MATEPQHVHCMYCNAYGVQGVVRTHIANVHKILMDEQEYGVDYANGDTKQTILRLQALDRENAALGFRKWLDSIEGADDFLIDAGGL